VWPRARIDPSPRSLISAGEHLRDQAHVAVDPHVDAVRHGDARRLLAAMLQGEEAEVRQVGDVDAALGTDSEYAAHA
jgi:hypothetical protein